MEGVLAYVAMFGGNFAPRGWAFCQGQLMAISQNSALFSLVGTTYGGDGVNTFGLPDLRGRVAKGVGQGPGLSNYQLGQMSGSESATLSVANIGNHTHALTGSAGILIAAQDGHAKPAINTFPAGNGDPIYSSATDNSTMAPASVALTIGLAGSGPVPVSIRKPYLVINFIIALEGIYPSRN